MRRFAIVGALLLSLVSAGSAEAILPGNTTFTVFAQVHGGGYGGVISLTKMVDNSSAKLEVDLTGMHTNQLATAWARAGSCTRDGFGVVRVRFVSAFRGGHWKASYPMTPQMLGWWNAALKTGAVHFTLSQAGHTLCGDGEAV